MWSTARRARRRAVGGGQGNGAADDGAENRAEGGAEEDGVGSGVHDEAEASVGSEAEEEGNGGVAEDVHVGQFEGQGGAGRAGGRDAEADARDGGGDVVAHGEAGSGGQEGGGGQLGVTAQPGVADDVAGGADRGDGGRDAGRGRIVFFSAVSLRAPSTRTALIDWMHHCVQLEASFYYDEPFRVRNGRACRASHESLRRAEGLKGGTGDYAIASERISEVVPDNIPSSRYFIQHSFGLACMRGKGPSVNIERVTRGYPKKI